MAKGVEVSFGVDVAKLDPDVVEVETGDHGIFQINKGMPKAWLNGELVPVESLELSIDSPPVVNGVAIDDFGKHSMAPGSSFAGSSSGWKPWDQSILAGVPVYVNENLPPGTISVLIPHEASKPADPYVDDGAYATMYKMGDMVLYGPGPVTLDAPVVGKEGPVTLGGTLAGGKWDPSELVVGVGGLWDPEAVATKGKPLWGKVLAQDCADPGATTERWTCPWCGVNWLEKPTGEDVGGCPECGEFPLEGEDAPKPDEDAIAAVVKFNESLQATAAAAATGLAKLNDSIAALAPAFTKAFSQMQSSALEALVQSNVLGAGSPLTPEDFDAAVKAVVSWEE